jgi:hypothetical protein
MTLRARRGTDQSDTFKIDELPHDWKLIDLCAWTLRRATQRTSFASASDRDIQYTVRDVRADDRVLTFEVIKGSTGIESSIEREGDDPFNREVTHRENIGLRCMIVFPEGGHHAFVLLERISNIGVASFIQKLLLGSLRPRLPEATITLDPLATAADLAETGAILQAITFKLPMPGDRSGRREAMDGIGGKFALKWTLGGQRQIRRFADADGTRIEASKVFGVLSDALGAWGSSLSSDGAIERQAQADLTVKQNGSQRTFTLGTDEGPSIVYPILPTGETAAREYTERPSGLLFEATCKRVITDLDGRYDVTASTVHQVTMPPNEHTGEVPEHWKVEWDAPTGEVAL